MPRPNRGQNLTRWKTPPAALLKDGLIALGLGKSRKVVSDKVLNRFYMHRIGHFLGLDVHDVGVIKTSRSLSPRLRPGMVITVEPGLYIPNDDDIPRALRGMGVRIEDDILITPSGRQVLSEDAPKTRFGNRRVDERLNAGSIG